MDGWKYLLLMLALAAIVSISTGHRGGNHGAERSDESDRDDDDWEDDDIDDDDRDDDDRYDGCRNNNVCCNYVNHMINVTQWVEHPCNGSEDGRTERSYREEPICYKKMEYIVNITVCYKVCCEGWVRDEYGLCTVPSPPEIQCENGGTPDPTGSAHCLCSNDFTGRQCETAVCHPPCDNGGECIPENGHSICLCSEGFIGTQCEQPLCPERCQNGGSCVSMGYYAACQCPPGFSGMACEHRVRPGTCPSIRDMGDLRSTHRGCTFDDHCPNSDKCCPSRYGKFCVTPGTPTCLHDGQHYKAGEEVSRGVCEKCTCIRPSILHQNDDEFACYTIDCPPLSCTDYIYHKDKCCPVCNVKLPREPQISDCPTKTIELAVQADKNMINVAERFKSIHALDHKMNVLKVTFSHVYLRSCACNYTELDIQQISVVSEPDTYGRVAYCSFTVKVIDVHSPRFSHCPSMISAFTDEKIIWRSPAVSDNVGVREMNFRAKYANNTMFPEGKHYVEYYAKDFHKNVAICRIPVSVYTRGTTDPSLPVGMRMSSTDRSKHNLYIGVGVGAAVLLLLLLLGMLYCRSLRKSSPPQQAPVTKDKTANAFDNGIYSEGVRPPPYDNIAFEGEKGGPPSYKPGTPPPVYRANSTAPDYESIAVSSVTSGVENQLYMDESMYHSIPAASVLSNKEGEGENSPPPSFSGVPTSPDHYEQLDVQSVASKVVYDEPNQGKTT
ncbi:protein jagged-1b-like [Ylistrum balloti]|uniref:protein jagged-1b-like n=1 Tax=Ylistrum balloti TaxID=509963 RepID=UPI002905D66A|nr:protein jagged-1b-like [Ylistrum balloti]